jgi:fatty-acyl-CoA synthase
VRALARRAPRGGAREHLEAAPGGGPRSPEATHPYGLTDSYGPATICAWQPEWDHPELPERSRHVPRQGVAYPTLDALMVADPVTLTSVPRDGATMGEVMLRGNTVMKGYLRNAVATEEVFPGGSLHTGDLAVWHVSSLEVEEVLYRHRPSWRPRSWSSPTRSGARRPVRSSPSRPDAAPVTARDIVAWCREHLAHFKAPRNVVFGPLPKTSTGKIQKYVLREQAKAVD